MLGQFPYVQCALSVCRSRIYVRSSLFGMATSVSARLRFLFYFFFFLFIYLFIFVVDFVIH